MEPPLMGLEQRPEPTPPTNEELLDGAEKYLRFARKNYGGEMDGNEYSQTAALVSIANSALVIARLLGERGELPLPEQPLPPVTPEGQ
jgi:hypothetical protein